MSHTDALFGAVRSALAADTSLPPGWQDDPALRRYVWDVMRRATATRPPIGRFVPGVEASPQWRVDAEEGWCPEDAGRQGDVVVWGVRRCGGVFLPAQRGLPVQRWVPWLRGWLLDAVDAQLDLADAGVAPWLPLAREHARIVRASLSVRRARVRQARYWASHEPLRVALW